MTVFSFNIRELPTYDKDLPFNIKDNGWGCIVWVLNLGKKKKKKKVDSKIWSKSEAFWPQVIQMMGWEVLHVIFNQLQRLDVLKKLRVHVYKLKPSAEWRVQGRTCAEISQCAGDACICSLFDFLQCLHRMDCREIFRKYYAEWSTSN